MVRRHHIIHTWEGWLYLATVIDLGSRRVVGWATADHLRTDLIDQALTNAVTSRRPARGVIFHSDRGCQYTSAQYRRLADQHGVRLSVGPTARRSRRYGARVRRLHRPGQPAGSEPDSAECMRTGAGSCPRVGQDCLTEQVASVGLDVGGTLPVACTCDSYRKARRSDRWRRSFRR